MIAASQRPPLELAEVINRHGQSLEGPLSGQQRRILLDIATCRTAVRGGHVQTCDGCQHQRIAYNSCRNRHCPRCQGSAAVRWMEDRAGELLPVEYFHVVFTLPDAFNALALANKRVVYGVLFDAVSRTLLEVAANPKHLGARIGLMAILHTWGQNLSLHPHVHCIVPGGGIRPDGKWRSCRAGFFLPVRVLSRVFRGKFIDGIKRARVAGRLFGVQDDRAFDALLDASVKHDWVVYAKPPFGGPAQVLRYLSRYTHRIAISNRRLLGMDDHRVTFGYKDYAHGNRPRRMMLDATEFLRRFLLHAVPGGFMRIRHYGLLANRVRKRNLAACRPLLGAALHLSAPRRMAVEWPPLCPVCGRGHLLPGRRVSVRDLLCLRMDSS